MSQIAVRPDAAQSSGEDDISVQGVGVNSTMQLLPLLGVVIGGGMAFLSTGVIERGRWRRQQGIRWDDRRLDAYITYAATVKRNSTAAAELLAGRGIVKTIRSVAQDIGLEELSAAEAARSAAFEGVLLLGDTPTIEAGTLLNHQVWRMQAMGRGELPVDASVWRDTFTAYRQARLNFYTAARESMGVPPAQMPASSAWLEELVRESSADERGAAIDR